VSAHAQLLKVKIFKETIGRTIFLIWLTRQSLCQRCPISFRAAGKIRLAIPCSRLISPQETFLCAISVYSVPLWLTNTASSPLSHREHRDCTEKNSDTFNSIYKLEVTRAPIFFPDKPKHIGDLLNLVISKTGRIVIVHHADSLHERIADS
jgi:hypothetical protein